MAITAKRFTLAEYDHLIELGFFDADRRIELIRGELIYMASKGMLHEVCLTRLIRELSPLLANRATIRCQSPIVLPPNSEPEPDFAIVRNRDDDYLTTHPAPPDILLIIEISDSSLPYDQDIKLKLFAEANLLHYWIFNLPEQVLEAYSAPYQKPLGESGYRVKQTILPDERIALPSFPDLVLPLTKIFPKKQ